MFRHQRAIFRDFIKNKGIPTRTLDASHDYRLKYFRILSFLKVEAVSFQSYDAARWYVRMFPHFHILKYLSNFHESWCRFWAV
jgi:hypothetical protein